MSYRGRQKARASRKLAQWRKENSPIALQVNVPKDLKPGESCVVEIEAVRRRGRFIVVDTARVEAPTGRTAVERGIAIHNEIGRLIGRTHRKGQNIEFGNHTGRRLVKK